MSELFYPPTHYPQPAPSDSAGESSAGGIEIFAEVGARLGRLADVLEARERRIEEARQSVSDRIPIALRRAGQGNASAAGVAIVDLGGPDQGRRWEIRSAFVGGAQVNATPAGSGYLFVSAANPDSAQTGDLSVVNARDLISTALPDSAFWSADQLIVEFPEHVWIVIVSGTNGLTYAGNVTGLDYDIILQARSALQL